MAKKKPDNSTTPRTDPRLKSFLRKAAAIIAVEKGLNAESQRKLQSLADRDQLPTELYQEALFRLQSSSESTSILSHYERAFVTFLDSEFEKISGGIVSPRVEQEALKLAKLKFEINGTRAQQLIDARAAAAGIELISQPEAIAYANQSIVEQIGDATFVDEDLRSQLRQFGQRWWLDEAEIDRVISRQVGRNRAIQQRGYLLPIGMVAIVLLLTVGLSLTAYTNGWILSGWRMEPKSGSENNPLIADSTVNTTRFSDSLVAELEQFVESQPVFQSSVNRILDEDPTQSALGYQSFVTLALSLRRNQLPQPESILSKLFHQDPIEDSARTIVSSLEDSVSSTGRTTSTVQDLRNAYQANQILGKLYFGATEPKDGVRHDWLADSLEKSLLTPIDELTTYNDFIDASEPQIANEQWNRLFQTAWQEPTQASVVLEPLIELTRSKLPEDSLKGYRDDAVVAILQNDVSRWKVLQNQIRETIDTAEVSRLGEWISIFESSTDPECQVAIGGVLMPRLGIRAKSRRQEDIVEAISRFNLSSRNEAVRPIVERSKQMDRLFETTINSLTDKSEPASPDQIARLALLNNIEWAFCLAIENATHIDDQSFSDFDRLIGLPVPKLRDLISLPFDRQITDERKPGPAMASDRRRFENAIQRISDQDANTNGLKMLAMKDLSQIAHRFDDISYEDAQAIAAFLLSSVKREELLVIEQLIDSFSHWSNLALAIADQVPNSNTELDQAITIARLLLNGDFELGKGNDWRTELQHSILVAVATDVATQVLRDSDSPKSNWNRLGIYLLDLYRERLVLSNRSAINPPFVSAYQWTQQLATSAATDTDRNDIISAIALNEKFSPNEIEKAIFANQLWIKVITRRLEASEFEDSAKQITEDLVTNLNSTSFTGDKLLATELALLKILDLQRHALVQRLLNREVR